MLKILAFVFTLSLIACSSNPQTYYVKPSPLHKNETQYSIRSVVVDLELGEEALAGDTTFANEKQLKKQFSTALIAQMKEAEIYAETTYNNSFSVNINIHYTRQFNYGGGSLNKPHVSHEVTVFDEHNKKVASFSNTKYTTSYGGLKNAAVNFEIAVFSWDEEDEPQDIEIISKIIIDDLADLGV